MSIEGAGGTHIIITGASSGIGEAIARHLAAQGHRLTLAARRAEQLQALAAELNPSGKRILAVPTDVTKTEDLQRLVERSRAIFGPVGALINNAGAGSHGKKGAGFQMQDARRIIETNVLAVMELTQLVLPEMQAQKNGHIINIGSVAGRVASTSLYSSSKFAVRGFSLALRRELLGSGVHVSLVSPGFIKTNMTSWGPPLPMPGPEIVARTVANLLEHPRAETIVPWWYNILVASNQLFPFLGDAVVKRMYASRSESK